MKNNTSESELLISQLCANTLEILNRYWKQAELLSTGEDELKIGITHSIKIAPKGGFNTESSISFGKRVKDTVKHTIDPNQTEMAFKEAKSADGEVIEKPKRLRAARA